MNYTYIASDNTASDADSFGASGQDVYVKKIIFGTPGDGEGVKIYNKATAFGHASGLGSTDSSDVAFYFTQPTAATGKPYVTEIDFTGVGSPGLQVDGGAVHTDSSQVTVIWEEVDEVS